MEQKIRSFFESISVIDFETTTSKPKDAEICQVGLGYYNNDDWEIESYFYKTKNPIPPEASSLNDITDEMVKDCVYFDQDIHDSLKKLRYNKTNFYVAHNAEYELQVLESYIKNNTNHENSVNFIDKNKWICTKRLIKHYFNDNSIQTNLNYLRHYFGLNISNEIRAHRADNDVLITIKLLEYLIKIFDEENYINKKNDIGEQLKNLSWKPIEYTSMPFGKYKNVYFDNIPDDYFRWLILKADALNSESNIYNHDLAKSIEKYVSIKRPNLTKNV